MADSAMNEVATETAPAPVCVVEMHVGKPCGRPIHSARDHDQEPVCLMHSKDPAKNDADFQAEFERILEEAERAGTIADFSKFVFASANYSARSFDADFAVALFTKEADFRNATFTQGANFRAAEFAQSADFVGATFTQNADFAFAIFTKEAGFASATFTQGANFRHAEFAQSADFSGATFTQDANFTGAKFTQSAEFHHSMFTQYANFYQATFTQDAMFTGAKFTQSADFFHATFSRGALFERATFSGTAKFRETHFRHDPHHEPGLDFSDVKIEHPENVEFYKTDLSQALFYNTDVSKIDFTLVEWRNRGQTGWLRHFGRRYWGARFYLFEEDVDLGSAEALRSSQDSPDDRNYSLIAETYQQLKRNYDAKGDYWTAGHWHYGEMEMKRMHTRWRWRPLRWVSHHFSLVALYKYASEYGESYLLPLVCLAGVLSLFAVLYPVAGLELSKDSGGGVVGYWNMAEFFRAHPAEHPSGWSGLLLHGFMTSISVAGFQRELKYAPSYPWGRLMALDELLLTTTLGGLFALAIRRQFKRS